MNYEKDAECLNFDRAITTTQKIGESNCLVEI